MHLHKSYTNGIYNSQEGVSFDTDIGCSDCDYGKEKIKMIGLDKDKAPIRFGDKEFIDVTNETCAGLTFSYYEAKIYGEEGRIIATSD